MPAVEFSKPEPYNATAGGVAAPVGVRDVWPAGGPTALEGTELNGQSRGLIIPWFWVRIPASPVEKRQCFRPLSPRGVLPGPPPVGRSWDYRPRTARPGPAPP